MDYDALREQLEQRMFRVQASHEAAIVLRNALAQHVDGAIRTNRHSGADHFHIEMDQDVAATILAHLISTMERDYAAQDTTEPEPGVWVVGHHDYYWHAEHVFPGTQDGEIAALRVINRRGYGDVKHVTYGEEGTFQ